MSKNVTSKSMSPDVLPQKHERVNMQTQSRVLSSDQGKSNQGTNERKVESEMQQQISPMRQSTNRRSRQDRAENRSSVEGMSKIMLASETLSSNMNEANEVRAIQNSIKMQKPPKSSSQKDYPDQQPANEVSSYATQNAPNNI